MNRANGIGPVTPDLVADPCRQPGSLGDVGEIGRRLAPELGTQVGHASMLAPLRRQPHGRGAARAPAATPVRRGCARRAAPGSARPRPQRSASRATDRRSGPPAASRRRSDLRAGQPASSAPNRCASGRRAYRRSPPHRGAPGARRATGPVPLEERAQHARRRPLSDPPRTQTAFLDQRPRPRRRAGFQPGEVRGRHAAGHQELGRGVVDDLRIPASASSTAAHRQPERFALQRPPSRTRSSGPSMSTPSRVRRRRSSTGTPVSSSQRGNALSLARSGTSASAARARATAITSPE